MTCTRPPRSPFRDMHNAIRHRSPEHCQRETKISIIRRDGDCTMMLHRTYVVVRFLANSVYLCWVEVRYSPNWMDPQTEQKTSLSKTQPEDLYVISFETMALFFARFGGVVQVPHEASFFIVPSVLAWASPPKLQPMEGTIALSRFYWTSS